MPSHPDDTLISLTEPSETDITSPTLLASSAPVTSRMAAERCKRDSFSDLAGLMKAKKSYMPIPTLSPKPLLSVLAHDMQFASRVGSGSSVPSPLARPYHLDRSVAAYLQDQAHLPTTTITSPASEYRQQDMHRLESMLKELENLPVNNDDDNANVQQRDQTVEPLVPDLELPVALSIHTGPISPLTPVESAKPVLPEEPVVRVTMHVWDSMSRVLEALKEEKRALDLKVARLEKQKAIPQFDEHKGDLQTQIGKLQYQNESNKVQKATMARTLSDKDVLIKRLQQDLDSTNERLKAAQSAAEDYAEVASELDYLQATLKNGRTGDSRLLSDPADIKDRKIQTLSQKIDDLGEALRQTRIERDATTYNGKHEMLAQKRSDQLNQREELLRSTQEKYAVEHIKVGQLEDHVEDLQRKLNQVGDLQSMLREKTSNCDRIRTKLKTQEKLLEESKQRLLRASNEGQALRGAAHLVRPAPNTKLSTIVMGCAECYAKNISCDNKFRCRHCTENNENCVRWRCSLKHILGQCPNVPCTFPHEADGWLLASEPRPQW